MKEEWRPVVGYEESYAISSKGNIKSTRYNRRLTPSRCGSKGYYQIGLFQNGISKRFYIHRLVAMAFLGLRDETHIDHIDGNSINNDVRNLRLCTRSQNQHNRVTQVNNTSGCVGVAWNKASRKWYAYIGFHGKQVNLGYYNDMADAVAIRKDAKNRVKKHLRTSDRQ